MKALTIEQLKALEVGDWVWVVSRLSNIGIYEQIRCSDTTSMFFDSGYCISYSEYETKWAIYKNKEQAETKGEIVETGKYFIEPEQLPNRPLRYLICDYSIVKGVSDMCDTKEEAERRLKELKENEQ